jgi:GTP cyclohydrolase IA
MNKRILTHHDVMIAARAVAEKIYTGSRPHQSFLVLNSTIALYGVPRGGIPAAYAVASFLPKSVIVEHPSEADYIVDDVVDSGTTAERYVGRFPVTPFYSLFPPSADWLVFPWEVGDTDASADDIPTRLLQFVGEDPEREGLRDTPKRFLAAWRDYTTGYAQDPGALLKTFEDGAEKVDELVLVRDIPVYSHCEHHLAPFFGVAHIAYIPCGKVLGLSKFARLVDVFAKRLQVQERMTQQIAHALNDALVPRGVGVVLECRHLCMEQRGVRARGASTTTSCLLGALKKDDAARAEFMRLVR